METAMITDFDVWASEPNARKWLEDRRLHARAVLLVKSPGQLDYDPSDNRWLDYTEFDAVIRNTGNLDPAVFTQKALQALKDFSNINPAVSIDSAAFTNLYTAAGVLVTLTRKDF